MAGAGQALAELLGGACLGGSAPQSGLERDFASAKNLHVGITQVRIFPFLVTRLATIYSPRQLQAVSGKVYAV